MIGSPRTRSSAPTDFVPETYWARFESSQDGESQDVAQRILSAIQSGRWSDLQLPNVSFGGLEDSFLPKYLSCEVEIARITLESTTADVTSVRARPTRRGIAYRVVDEYNTKYSFRPRTSRRPLSLAQLINLIEGLSSDGTSAAPAEAAQAVSRM